MAGTGELWKLYTRVVIPIIIVLGVLLLGLLGLGVWKLVELIISLFS